MPILAVESQEGLKHTWRADGGFGRQVEQRRISRRVETDFVGLGVLVLRVHGVESQEGLKHGPSLAAYAYALYICVESQEGLKHPLRPAGRPAAERAG